MVITLNDVIALVPDNARIGVVESRLDAKYGKTFHTLYSGYKKTFIEFCNHQCIYPYGYEVETLHSGAWECKKGLIIGVKLIENEKKK